MTKAGDVAQDFARSFAEKHGNCVKERCERCHNSGYLRDPSQPFVIGTPPVYCGCAWGNAQQAKDMQDRDNLLTNLKASRRRALARKLVLPDTHAAYTLDSHPLRGSESYQQIMDWLSAWDWRRGLVLIGDYGVGKTGLIVGIMQSLRERAVNEGWSMRFVTSLQLIHKLQAGFADNSYSETLEEYSTAHLLALDDLCAEGVTGWRQEQFLTILRARYNADLPLLATTNCNEQELRERLTDRVYWCLYERCDFIAIEGANLRVREGASL